jgi:hypothetical protein
MFLGHFGLGFATKKATPEVSLGTLFLACQFADLLWPTLLLLRIERVEIEPGATKMSPLDFVSYPYSHSLLMLCIWGVAFGVIYAAIRRSRLRAAVALALLVVSHWVLDVVMHRPDMPLTVSGSMKLVVGRRDTRRRADRVPGRHRAVCAIDRRARSCRLDRALVARALHAGGLCRRHVRSAAAYVDRGRVVGAGDVAAGGVGILGGQSPAAESELRFSTST